MKVLIIEDEFLFQLELKKMLLSIDPSIVILQTISTIKDAVHWLKHNESPELIFLDIKLADGNSFEIFEHVDVKSPIIFVTAYNDYAIKAFELNSIDYLIKPIDENKLRQSINKYNKLKNIFFKYDDYYSTLKQVIKEANSETAVYKNRLLVYKGNNLIPVNTDDIAYFYSEDKVNFLISNDNQKYINNTTLESLEQQLNPKEFFRVNRTFIINIHAIKKISPYFNYKLKVEVIPDIKMDIVVSRERTQGFKEWLNS
ncbi:MAG: response regulator transcription factor [Bacteroidia bacterium]|nr:response regulator transcription factor [Bacteroidia bacterium]